MPFLAQTANMEDLILNAMALTCILGFDDLVFAVLIPRRARRIIERCKPLQWSERRRHCGGADVVTFVRFLIVVASLFIIHKTMIAPFAEQLLKVQQEICKEPTDFIYALNPKFGHLEWAQTGSGDADRNQSNATYRSD